ncbi:MAG TPA: DUF6285 domain-containing protein [Candidatus Angelobacter sp.]|jgi:hypothetical protein|nr:DUF6285 domain-containing protein [Candidatus Angelobacter sp.]
MPSSLPSAPDLLAVVREFLENDILPASGLDDDKRFNVRVAVNLLATVERELRLGPEAAAAEASRLAKLVSSGNSVEEKNRFLAQAIRAGATAPNDPQLLDHIRRTLVDALRINNPKWLNEK